MCFDPVGEVAQAVTVGIGAARAVVADLDQQSVGRDRDVNADQVA
jgi:hypothetical protein